MKLTNKQVLDAAAGLNRLAQIPLRGDDALIVHENIVMLEPFVKVIEGTRTTLLAKSNGKSDEPSEEVKKDWEKQLAKTGDYDLGTIEYETLRRREGFEIEALWLGALIRSGIVKLAAK